MVALCPGFLTVKQRPAKHHAVSNSPRDALTDSPFGNWTWPQSEARWGRVTGPIKVKVLNPTASSPGKRLESVLKETMRFPYWYTKWLRTARGVTGFSSERERMKRRGGKRKQRERKKTWEWPNIHYKLIIRMATLCFRRTRLSSHGRTEAVTSRYRD